MTKYILSVDGGGIRGIIPAMILAEVEKRTNKRISDIFHLIAGTSTGGLVAAGLCKKGNPQYSANDLVELYKEHGPNIFKKTMFGKAISWVNSAQYSHKPLEKVLDNYFGESTLTDTSSKLLLTSYDIYDNSPCFFKSWDEETKNIMLKDALRATTAAPTYFIPKQVEVQKEGKLMTRVLVDGGMFANNPAACAYVGAKKLFPNDKLVLLSVGTGRTYMNITLEEAKTFGRVSWVGPLVHVMFSSGLDAINYQLDKILGTSYLRIQSELEYAKKQMDNTTSENMEALQKDAYKMIENNKESLDKFCSSIP